MAFRRSALVEVGGFNVVYRRAGDDVDLCWRLQARGWRIGFAPAALVWHHHRASARAYWRQQVGYGEGEEWLAPHHPDRFRDGHAVWRGHIYSPLPFVRALSRAQVNTGPWGTAAFPSVYLRDAYPFAFMPHKVRWLIVALILVGGGFAARAVGAFSLGFGLVAAGGLGLSVTVVTCVLFALESDLAGLAPIGRLSSDTSRVMYRLVIAWLHFIQPFARAWGRLRGLLADVELPDHAHAAGEHRVRPSWRSLVQAVALVAGARVERQFWSEGWTEAEAFLSLVRDRLQRAQAIRAIEVDDGWQHGRDISVQVAAWGWLDLRVLAEDHGSGKRLFRVTQGLRCTPLGFLALAGAAGAAVVCIAFDVEYREVALSSAVLASVAAAGLWSMWQTARAVTATERVIARAAATLHLLRVHPRRGVRAGTDAGRRETPATLVSDAAPTNRTS
jgi:hypothetical protein